MARLEQITRAGYQVEVLLECEFENEYWFVTQNFKHNL